MLSFLLLLQVITFIIVVENIYCTGNEFEPEIKHMKTIEDFAFDYENEKNSMIAHSQEEDYDMYRDFYDEFDNRIRTELSMNILFFGPPSAFLRLDAESLLHILAHTKKYLIPKSRVLLAWDIVTDGKTAAFLQGRELLSFGYLLNYIPEEELYYMNFGDISVLKYFADFDVNLRKRKYTILTSAYKRYLSNYWYENSTFINDMGYLLCGFTCADLGKISPKVFIGINVDVFDKLKRCTYDQKQILYKIATNPEAYGLPHKWSSHEINRLGSLFANIPKYDISSVPYEAITAISPNVMKLMIQEKLEYFTKQQILRMNKNARRIYIIRMQLKASLDMNQIARSSQETESIITVLLLYTNVVTVTLFYNNLLFSSDFNRN